MVKYEAQIRNHISVEQQFLLHFEAMQTRIESQQAELLELQGAAEKAKAERKTGFETKDVEITLLKSTIKDLESEVKRLKDEA